MTAPDVRAPDSVAADRAQGQSRNDDAIVPDAKAFSTLQARAALAGCALHRLADGEFLLCQWGLSRACPDLRAVAALLERIGGRS